MNELKIGSIGVCLELDYSPLFVITKIIDDIIFIETIDRKQSFPYSIRLKDFWVLM